MVLTGASTLQRVLAVPCLLDILRLVNEFPLRIVLLPFKPQFSHCTPKQVSLCAGYSVVSLPTVGCCIGGDVLIITESLSLPPFSIWSFCHLLCRSCSVIPQIFRQNCSICRCRFIVSMRGSKFRIFLSHHLDYPFFCFSILLKILVGYLKKKNVNMIMA